ncbi:unnamed protein product, partial [Amoebophrya sp. A120]
NECKAFFFCDGARTIASVCFLCSINIECRISAERTSSYFLRGAFAGFFSYVLAFYCGEVLCVLVVSVAYIRNAKSSDPTFTLCAFLPFLVLFRRRTTCIIVHV